MNAYKRNKNLYTFTLIKIVMYCKLNNYNTINDCIDTNIYYSILVLVRGEPCYIANSNFKDKDIGINNSKLLNNFLLGSNIKLDGASNNNKVLKF